MSVRTGKIVFSCCLLCSSVVMLLKKGISYTCVLCDVVQVCVCVIVQVCVLTLVTIYYLVLFSVTSRGTLLCQVLNRGQFCGILMMIKRLTTPDIYESPSCRIFFA